MKTLDWSETEAEIIDFNLKTNIQSKQKFTFNPFVLGIFGLFAIFFTGFYINHHKPFLVFSQSNQILIKDRRLLTPVMNFATEIIGANEENGKIKVYGKKGEVFSNTSVEEDKWIKEDEGQPGVLSNEERMWISRDNAGRNTLITANENKVKSIYNFLPHDLIKTYIKDFHSGKHLSSLISGNVLRVKDDWSLPINFKENLLDADCFNQSCVSAFKDKYLWTNEIINNAKPQTWTQINSSEITEKREVCVISSQEFISIEDSRQVKLWIKNSEKTWIAKTVFVANGEEELFLNWGMNEPNGDKVIILTAINLIDSSNALIEVRLSSDKNATSQSIFYTPLPANFKIKFIKNSAFRKLLLFSTSGLVYSYK